MPDIDTSNDEVVVFADLAGAWRWRRVDKGNRRIVANSAGDGYDDKAYAVAAAKAYNVGVAVRVLDG